MYNGFGPPKSAICNKMFEDLIISFDKKELNTCCKATSYDISNQKITPDIFYNNQEYNRRKHSMIFNNELPKNSCEICSNSIKNSFFYFRNYYKHKDFSVVEKENLYNNINFRNFHIRMSLACDLKCIHCSEVSSSSWLVEKGFKFKKDNKFKEELINNFLLMLSENKNHLLNKPLQFIFSGGEPLVNLDCLELIEKISNIFKEGNIKFMFTTNLNCQKDIFNEYIDYVLRHQNYKWHFNCSVDGIEERAEAIRTNLNWERFLNNLNVLIDMNSSFKLFPTLTAYSAESLPEFLNFFINLFLSKGIKLRSDIFTVNYAAEDDMCLRYFPKEIYYDKLLTSMELIKPYNLIYYDFIEKEKELIGLHKNIESTNNIENTFNYFKLKRPEYDWGGLFPDIIRSITMLKEEFNI